MRDNWAVGFGGRYTVGVWVGNFSGDPMHDVSGVTGAAPVWREVMDYLTEGGVPAAATPPAGLGRRRGSFADGSEPARDEGFVAGTESSLLRAVDTPPGRPHITSPRNSATSAIDPDIPGQARPTATM